MFSYLLQHHSGYFVDDSAAKLKLAQLCTSYLTFPCFNPYLDISNIEVSVYKGEYAFQEYAVLNWIHHVKSLTEHEDNVDISSLKNSVSTLYRRHLEQFDPGNSDSSIQDLEIDRHNIPAALSDCQKLYQIVDNINADKNDPGKVMTPTSLKCS